MDGSDVRHLLADAGISVVDPPDNSEQAIAIANEPRPDATLLDATCRTPRCRPTTGYSAYAEISHQPLAPVVLLVDNTQAEQIQEALDAGVMGYVVRPFTRSRLIPAIEMAMTQQAVIAVLRAEIAYLADRLDARKVIERAKGPLIFRRQLSEQNAFRLMQSKSMDHRTAMRSVAHTSLNNSLRADLACRHSAPLSAFYWKPAARSLVQMPDDGPAIAGLLEPFSTTHVGRDQQSEVRIRPYRPRHACGAGCRPGMDVSLVLGFSSGSVRLRRARSACDNKRDSLRGCGCNAGPPSSRFDRGGPIVGCAVPSSGQPHDASHG